MSLKALKSDILGFLSDQFKSFPMGFEMYFLHKKIHFLHDPKEIKEMMMHEKDYYQKSKTYDELGRFLGQSILCTNDWKFWLQNRGAMQKAFTKKAVAHLADDIQQVLDDYFHKFQYPCNLALKEHSNAIFADVVIFGILNSQVPKEYDPIKFSKHILFLAQFAEYRLKTPFKLPVFLPLKKHLKYRRIMKEIQPVLQHIITHSKGDTINALVHLLKEGKISEKDLFNEVLTMIVAGQETTASSLAFSLYLLDQNESYQGQLRFLKEFDRKEEYQVLLRNVINESLRLYPPAWAVSRKAIQNHKLGSRSVKKGNIVFASIFHLHRHSSYSDAHDFIPERWNDEMNKDCFMPFGRGKRQCIGNHLAMLELEMAIDYIITHFNFKCTNSKAFKLNTPITLGTVSEMYFEFEKRI